MKMRLLRIARGYHNYVWIPKGVFGDINGRAFAIYIVDTPTEVQDIGLPTSLLLVPLKVPQNAGEEDIYDDEE